MGLDPKYCDKELNRRADLCKRSLNWSSANGFSLVEDGRERKPEVTIKEYEIAVGCTTVSRIAIEKLARLFQEHFPNNHEVKVQ